MNNLLCANCATTRIAIPIFTTDSQEKIYSIVYSIAWKKTFELDLFVVFFYCVEKSSLIKSGD